MGSGPSQSMRKLPTSSTIISDTTEDFNVLCADMASATAAAETVEQSTSATSRLGLTPEKIKRLFDSFQDVQEFLFLAPRLLEHQKELEKQMANFQSLKQAVSKDRVFVSEGNAENISSSNRPSALEMEYQTFYDHQRVDAIDLLQDSRLTKIENERDAPHFSDSLLACIIFEDAYHSALESKNCFLEGMSSILRAAPKIGADIFQTKCSDPKGKYQVSTLIDPEACKEPVLSQSVLNHFRVIMKETSDSCDVDALIQISTHKLHDRAGKGWFKDYDPSLLSKPGMENYIKECCQYAWKLVCQTPPYVLGTASLEKDSHRRFDPDRHQLCREFKHPELNSRSHVSFVVWPGLFVETPPRVIRKTEVIVKN